MGTSPFASGAIITSSWLNRTSERTLCPEDFGAIGNGKVDDTEALQNFLDASINQPAQLTTGKVYCFKYLNLNGHILDGQGATLKVLSGGGSTVMLTSGNSRRPDDYYIRMTNGSRIQNCFFDLCDCDVSGDTARYFINARSAEYCEISNCHFFGNETITTELGLTHIIYADNAKNLKIVGNRFSHFLIECIRAAATTYSEFSYNHFIDIGLMRRERLFRRRQIKRADDWVTDPEDEGDFGARFLNRAMIIGGSNYYQVVGNKFEKIGYYLNGNNLIPWEDVNGVCCIDVGGANYGVISGNVAHDVHSFIDIEYKTPNKEYQISVTDNTLSGFFGSSKKVGKGLWINLKTNPKCILFSGNCVKDFRHGITVTTASLVSIVGNQISNCANGIMLNTTRDYTCVGNTISNCEYGVINHAKCGFAGGIIQGNILRNITVKGIFISLDTLSTDASATDKVIVSDNFIYSLLSAENALDFTHIIKTDSVSKSIIANSNIYPVSSKKINAAESTVINVNNMTIRSGI